jgi:hypothetical protein
MPGGTNSPVLPGLGRGSQTPYPYDAYTLRISDVEPRLRAGPQYAADGAKVLEDWLEIDADELSELLASGAVVL